MRKESNKTIQTQEGEQDHREAREPGLKNPQTVHVDTMEKEKPVERKGSKVGQEKQREKGIQEGQTQKQPTTTQQAKTKTTKRVEQPAERGTDQSGEDTENDDEQKEECLRWRVKIVKMFGPASY